MYIMEELFEFVLNAFIMPLVIAELLLMLCLTVGVLISEFTDADWTDYVETFKEAMIFTAYVIMMIIVLFVIYIYFHF